MTDRGYEPGEETDKWVTGEAPTTLEEASETADDSFWDSLGEWMPYWTTWNETYYGMGVGFVLVVLVLLGVSTVVTWLDSSSLSGSVATVREAPSTDTYARWQEALEEATRIRAERPGGFRSFFHASGVLAPGAAPGQLRARLARLHAHGAALVEYRFEHEGSRRASVLLDDDLVWRGATSDDSDGDPPTAAAGRTLRALTRGRYDDALTIVEQAREGAPEDIRLLRAHLEAALAADRPDAVKTLAEKLKGRETTTTYDRYLLARSAPYHSELSAPTSSGEESSEESNDHLGLRTAEVAKLRREDNAERAREVGTKLLDGLADSSGEKAESGPSFQIARLHNEVGLACVAIGDQSCADDQFSTAAERAPRRGAAYVPRIATLLDRGKLAEAGDHLDRAEARAGRHAELTIARARLQYLRSRWDEAAATLDRVGGDRELAPVLRARILLELDEFQQAINVLGEVPSNALEADRVRALRLLASALASSEWSDEDIESMAELTDGSGDAVVLRAGARYHLERARAGGEGDPLERARTLLDRASNQSPNPEITTFLRCELHRVAEEWEKAGEACAEARRNNPAYLPGMLTAVRLRLQTQRPERAALLAERLAGRFDDWDVAKLQMRALIRSHRLDRAESVLDRWSDREVAGEPEYALFAGHLDYARADYKSAVGHYEKARKSHAYGEEADLYYTHTLVRLGRFEEAEALLDELTDLEAWKGKAWIVFGELRRRQDNDSDALENLRIAGRHIDEESAPRAWISELYGQFALAWQQRRDWSDSRVAANLEKARERGDPRSPAFAYPYGLYLMAETGDDRQPDRAVSHLSQTVDLQPYNCGAIKALETAYEETHDWAGRNEMRDLKGKRCPDED